MKIRLLSDLHREFFEDRRLYQSRGEDVLIIAGDLDVGHERCWSALKQFYEHQQNILYVSGNHEYYQGSTREFDDYIKRFSQGTGIKFLNPGYTKIGDVTFIGGTLWTNFRNDRITRHACVSRINDFRAIKDMSGDYCVGLHDRHFQYIKDSYEIHKGKKVIISHFLPAIELIDPEYAGPDLINGYFANDYGNWIADLKDTTWVFGHTHSLVNKVIGDTRCIANPYGYNRNPNYKEMVFEV